MLKRWTQLLRRRLSSDRTIVQSRDGLRDIVIPNLGNLWIVGRDSCAYRRMSVTGVPGAKLPQVVEAQVTLMSPYKQPGFWFHADSGEAGVWMWDEAQREQLAREAGIADDAFQVIPESCFTPEDEGVVLWHSVGTGYFALARSEGQLISDSWWPDIPTEGEWRGYLRGLGLSSRELGPPRDIDLTSMRPWPGLRLSNLATRSIESLAWKALALGFLFLFGFQLTGSVRLLLDGLTSDQQISALLIEHQETIVVRDEALALRDRLRQMSLLQGTRQVSLLNAVAESLPDSSGDLQVWQYQEGQLEFVVKDSAPDLEAYVRNLQAVPGLESVTVEPLQRASSIKVQASVVPR